MSWCGTPTEATSPSWESKVSTPSYGSERVGVEVQVSETPEEQLLRLELFLEFHRQMEPVWRRHGVMDPHARASDWLTFIGSQDPSDEALRRFQP